jgi:Cu2+-exporting ATPase
MQIMLYTVALYAGYFQGMEPLYRRAFQLIAWFLATPVVFYSGWPFARNTLRSLRRRVLNMDVLVFLGSFSAYAYSVAMVAAGGEVYFDTAAMIITLILLGRFLEAGARRRAGEAVAALMGLQPRKARRIGPSGERVTVAVASLAVGDVFETVPGEQVPLDGLVTEGTSEVDEAMLTGESQPVLKETGAEVFGGTLNLNGRLLVRVLRVGRDTVLSRIVQAVEEAQARKAPIQAVADRVVGWFVPAVLAVALGAFVHWWSAAGPARAFMNAVSVLVVACPCALGLATPLAVLVGTTAASRRGILVKGGDVLEAAARVDRVVFDKTGTLTRGAPVLTESVEMDKDSGLLRMAAALEAPCAHPVARAIVSAWEGELPPVSDFREVPGRGVRGIAEGTRGAVGNPALMRELGIPLDEGLLVRYSSLSAEGKTVVVVAREGRALGLLGLIDALKPGARDAVSSLKARGLTVSMVTGDAEAVGRSVAREAGIGDVAAGSSPLGKAAVVRELQEEGGSVLMLGDGINDAPALTEARVGAAVGRATDIALKSADAVFMKDDLGLAPAFVDIARRSLRVIRQNLFWAFSYNIVAVPLAVAGLLHPIVSAAAMAASSLVVVGNSLRLARR